MSDTDRTESVARILRQGLSPEEQDEAQYWAPLSAVVIELRRLRSEYGQSQSDVARAMDTRQSVISRFENLGRKPSYDFLSRLAQVFGGKLGLTLSGQYCALAPTKYRAQIRAEAQRRGIATDEVVMEALISGLIFTTWPLDPRSSPGVPGETAEVPDTDNEVQEPDLMRPQYHAQFDDDSTQTRYETCEL